MSEYVFHFPVEFAGLEIHIVHSSRLDVVAEITLDDKADEFGQLVHIEDLPRARMYYAIAATEDLEDLLHGVATDRSRSVVVSGVSAAKSEQNNRKIRRVTDPEGEPA